MAYFKKEFPKSQVPTVVFWNSLSPQMFKHGLADHLAEVQVSAEWLDLMIFDVQSKFEIFGSFYTIFFQALIAYPSSIVRANVSVPSLCLTLQAHWFFYAFLCDLLFPHSNLLTCVEIHFPIHPIY